MHETELLHHRLRQTNLELRSICVGAVIQIYSSWKLIQEHMQTLQNSFISPVLQYACAFFFFIPALFCLFYILFGDCVSAFSCLYMHQKRSHSCTCSNCVKLYNWPAGISDLSSKGTGCSFPLFCHCSAVVPMQSKSTSVFHVLESLFLSHYNQKK